MRDAMPLVVLGVVGWLAYTYLWKDNWVVNPNSRASFGLGPQWSACYQNSEGSRVCEA
jgi:hypothetical protein